MKVFELVPNDRHKSFYHKAHVYESEVIDGLKVLKSYDTYVASIDEKRQLS